MQPENMIERRNLLCLIAAIPLMPTVASAGAWSHESFANDGALDWVAEFTRTPTITFLQTTFALGTQGEYIENQAGESIIAAAEVVAASLDRPSPDLPKALQGLITTHRKAFSTQAKVARTAVTAVLGARSELREVWGERPDGFARWQGNVQQLLKRLQ